MSLIASTFTSAIIILAVTVVPLIFSRRSKLAKAKMKDNGEKYIDYSNFIFWVIYGGGSIFFVLGVLVYLFSDEPIAGIIFIIMGLIFLLPMVFVQVADTTINWTSDYICGPKSSMRLKKNRIFWDDITSLVAHPNQTIQLKDKFGKSVYWSVYFNGWYEVIQDLRRIRPDIDTSDFD